MGNDSSSQSHLYHCATSDQMHSHDSQHITTVFRVLSTCSSIQRNSFSPVLYTYLCSNRILFNDLVIWFSIIGPSGFEEHEVTGVARRHSKLLDGSSELALTYEDREGDWMLVGDVPWGYAAFCCYIPLHSEFSENCYGISNDLYTNLPYRPIFFC